MNCPFCGKTFDEEASRVNCSRCSLFSGCKNVKCPHCGYESPQTPASLKWLSKIRKKK